MAKPIYKGPLDEDSAKKAKARLTQLEAEKAKELQAKIETLTKAKDSLPEESAAAKGVQKEINTLENQVQDIFKGNSPAEVTSEIAEAAGRNPVIKVQKIEPSEAKSFPKSSQSFLPTKEFAPGEFPQSKEPWTGIKLGDPLDLSPETVRENLHTPSNIPPVKRPLDTAAGKLRADEADVNKLLKEQVYNERPYSPNFTKIGEDVKEALKVSPEELTMSAEEQGAKLVKSLEGIEDPLAKSLKAAAEEVRVNPSKAAKEALTKVATVAKNSGNRFLVAAGVAGLAIAGGILLSKKEEKTESEPTPEPTPGAPPAKAKEEEKTVLKEPQKLALDFGKTPERIAEERQQKIFMNEMGQEQKVKFLAPDGETKEMPLGDYMRNAYQEEKQAIAAAMDLYRQETSENRKAQILKSLIEGVGHLVNGYYGIRHAEEGVVVRDLKFDPMPWLDRSDEIRQNLSNNLAQAKNGVEIAEKVKSLSDEDLNKKFKESSALLNILGSRSNYAEEIKQQKRALDQFNFVNQQTQERLDENAAIKALKASKDPNATKVVQNIYKYSTQLAQASAEGDDKKVLEAKSNLAGLLYDPDNKRLLTKAEELAKESPGFFGKFFGVSDSDIMERVPEAAANLLGAPREETGSRDSRLKSILEKTRK